MMQVTLVVEEEEKEEKKTKGLGEARRRRCGMGTMGWAVRKLRDCIFLSPLLGSALIRRRVAVAVLCWCGWIRRAIKFGKPKPVDGPA